MVPPCRQGRTPGNNSSNPHYFVLLINLCLLISFLNSKDAFKREVLEETGFQAEPTTLLMVESAAGSWYRFVMAGNVTGMRQNSFLRFHFPYQISTGGTLKTPSQADSESLQAKWVRDLRELSLRAGDIIAVVDHARSFKEQLSNKQPLHPPVLPTPRSYSKLYLRLVICARRKAKYIRAPPLAIVVTD